MLITLDRHAPETLMPIRHFFSSAAYPLQLMSSAPIEGYRSIKKTIISSRKTSQEQQNKLDILQIKIRSMQTQLQKMIALESENQHLKALLSATASLPDKILLSEILAVDLDPFTHKILLNKGDKHGVKEGQAVLDASGVLGQIVHTADYSSTAIVLTDPNHAIPVQVSRNGLRTVVSGIGSATKLRVNYLPNNADIHEGDQLISSGLGGRFPKGYPVAVIQSIIMEATEPYLSIIATPLAHTNSNQDVVIVQPEREQ